jgi:hypothetical protein
MVEAGISSRRIEPMDICSEYEICDVCGDPVHLDESDDNEGRHKECNEGEVE